jgi:hypothetical protein
MNAYEQPERLAFLLRLWKVRDNGKSWRASLERVDSGEKRGFTSLEDLFTYLRLSTDPDIHKTGDPLIKDNQQCGQDIQGET